MTDLPVSLSLEIKTSRRAFFNLEERDLAGVGPDGHLVLLVTPRRLGGPRWVVIPAAMLTPGKVTADALAGKASEGVLTAGLQNAWSDWLLDEDVRRRLSEGGGAGLRERVRWCRVEHPPRRHRSRGSVREVRLDAALQALRKELDDGAGGGSQLEGHLHQLLIEDALEGLGYAILPNPIGVPDVAARLQLGDPAERPQQEGQLRNHLRAALADWEPRSARLLELRASLLALDEAEVRELGALSRLWDLPR